MSNQENMEMILRRIKDLESDIENLQRTPLFSILNQAVPAQLTGDVNNYDPGNYDILIMSSDASRTITGLQGGVAGRVLMLYNVGTNNIVLAHASGSSDSDNRIVTQSGANYTMATRTGVMLIYRFFQTGSGFNNWRTIFIS